MAELVIGATVGITQVAREKLRQETGTAVVATAAAARDDTLFRRRRVLLR